MAAVSCSSPPLTMSSNNPLDAEFYNYIEDWRPWLTAYGILLVPYSLCLRLFTQTDPVSMNDPICRFGFGILAFAVSIMLTYINLYAYFHIKRAPLQTALWILGFLGCGAMSYLFSVLCIKTK